MTKKAVNHLTELNISELQKQLSDFRSKLDRVNSQMSQLQIESHTLTIDISAINSELNRRIKPVVEPRISDHAILRYIERAFNIDIDSIKDRILTPVVVKAISDGASSVTVDGMKFRIVDSTIVTVLTRDYHKAKTSRIREPDALKEGIDEYYDELG